MTATQVFYRFLKEELSVDGYLYFHRLLRGENVGVLRETRLIRKLKSPAGSKTFVEDFLKQGTGGRSLSGFMMNLLKYIEPAITYNMNYNKDYTNRDLWGNDFWHKYSDISYRKFYVDLWHKFLKKNIENYDKRVFCKQVPDYKLKER